MFVFFGIKFTTLRHCIIHRDYHVRSPGLFVSISAYAYLIVTLPVIYRLSRLVCVRVRPTEIPLLQPLIKFTNAIVNFLRQSVAHEPRLLNGHRLHGLSRRPATSHPTHPNLAFYQKRNCIPRYLPNSRF